MELKEMIDKRRSVRKYTGIPVDDACLEKIKAFAASMKPLYPHIRVHSQIVTKDQVRFYFPWKTPQLIAIFSEKKEGYLENVGFLFQQLDLYLQSLGLGSCWLGLGKLKNDDVALDAADGLEFVILLAFGHPEGNARRTGAGEFQRKTMSEISDQNDPRLECARLAPSSTNSQPWYFTHEGETIHAYCSHAGLLRHAMLGTMNKIDMGIALAHLYVENPDTFRFFQAEAPAALSGHHYTGSFTL